MNMENLHRYVELAKQKKDLKASLKSIDDELADLELKIVEAYSEEGVQNMRVDGHSVFLSRRNSFKVKEGVTYHDVAQVLEELGLGQLVTVNHRSFGSYANEQVNLFLTEHPEIDAASFDATSALPSKLAALVDADVVVSVGARKA